ncbi:MAG: hypothetical protein IH587_07355, partial [Anaerolineae bacterium]|nr:hypothetical protein [Anaerolineae bacterium]
MMIRRIAILALGIACALGMHHFARAQDGAYMPFSWVEGDVALAYPADWTAPISARTETGEALTLMPVDAGSTAQITVEIVQSPMTRPCDLLVGRLGAEGVTAGTPTNTRLGGLAAIEVRGGTSKTGIGRGTVRADGSVLLVYGSADAAAGDALLLTFDDVAESLAPGARQMPIIPGGDGATFERLGSERLELGAAVLGSLQPGAAAQTWTYAGTAGEEISVFATDINRLEEINLRLRMT